MKKIEVVPYDESWPLQFGMASRKIKNLLGATALEVHHIGSTSVPELASKKDIDVLLVVGQLQDSLLLEKLGYTFKGELNIPLRYFFSNTHEEYKVNLHVCEKSHGFISLNLSFRDWLRTHKEDREQYQELKHALLDSPEAGFRRGNGRFSNYCLGKDSFIKDILCKAGYQGTTINFCMHDVEWKAAKNFRRKYFLGGSKREDPYAWTFSHQDHKHFILYKGSIIIGYAHVELLADKCAVMRMVFIEEKYKNEACNQDLRAFIEKWLKFSGYSLLNES